MLRYRHVCHAGNHADVLKHAVLVRMLDEDGKLLPPGSFIPAAERFGLMDKLDRWIISEALRQYGDLGMEADGPGIAINLSGDSLGSDGLADFVRESLAANAVPAQQVCFEITETTAINRLSMAQRLIASLRKLGCRFALDDFGSGLSSFVYLKKLPVDFLKIDGVFVRDILKDPIDRALVESINGVGHLMGLATVAEFVESEATLEELRRIGVDYVQGYHVGEPRPLLIPLAVALLISILVYLGGLTVSQALLNPCWPAAHFLAMDPVYARALSRRIHGLLFLVLALILVFSTGIQSTLAAEHWYLLRAVFFAVATVQLVWLVSTVHSAPPPLNNPRLRGVVVLLLLAGLVIELLGFRNLSLYLFKGLLGTAMLAVGLWLLASLLQDAFDGVDAGRYAWQRQLRDRLSLKEGEPVPGLIWLRFLTVLLIWLAFGITVVGLWGYSDTFWSLVSEVITEGFQLGPVRIIPIHWVTGIIVFSILVALVSWMRNEVLPGWVKKSRIERGAQEAIVTLSGYVGIIIAALIGLSLAGFSFTNLAIIAGALSVGIGFGLQNIVNNFISGIILLFERPIRTGDWIVVGNTEGYVRKISIRSTQIETFDRADVIVPNSELISNQVTNWMLRDPWGRVIVPVGVAYGSDVEKVRDLLLKIAMEHPLVITDGLRVSPPRVMFRGFGDSSLDFELRCFIRNVDQRLATLSELNFAIEKALREADIQIPFPQRDLHLRSVDPAARFGQPPE